MNLQDQKLRTFLYQSPNVGNIIDYNGSELRNSLSNSPSWLRKTNGKQEYLTSSGVLPAPRKGKIQEELQKCPGSVGTLPSELHYKLVGFVRPTGIVQRTAWGSLENLTYSSNYHYINKIIQDTAEKLVMFHLNCSTPEAIPVSKTKCTDSNHV